MANWDNLKSAVRAIIKENGNQEITGQVLQNVLISIISNLGNNIMYVGEATPITNPGTPDGPVFYFAFEPGTYINFSGIVVTDEALMLTWNNNIWSSRPLGFASADYVKENIEKMPYIIGPNRYDLDIADEQSNAIVRFENGHIRTKNFDSSNAPSLTTSQEADLDIADEQGNAIVRFENGHIRTKNFDSSKIKVITKEDGKKFLAIS